MALSRAHLAAAVEEEPLAGALLPEAPALPSNLRRPRPVARPQRQALQPLYADRLQVTAEQRGQGGAGQSEQRLNALLLTELGRAYQRKGNAQAADRAHRCPHLASRLKAASTASASISRSGRLHPLLLPAGTGSWTKSTSPAGAQKHFFLLASAQAPTRSCTRRCRAAGRGSAFQLRVDWSTHARAYSTATRTQN